MEFINTHITNRKKLLKRSVLFALALFGLFLLRYILSPEDVKLGLRHSRRGLSFNELVFFSTLLLITCIGVITYSRLVLRLIISDSDKTLTVQFIERFRVKPKTVTVHLSQLQISKIVYQDKQKEYYSLSLTNKAFGTLNITEIDFADIRTVTDYFETMKILTAERMRKKRLLKKNSKPRSV